jgi:hypothetical protein
LHFWSKEDGTLMVLNKDRKYVISLFFSAFPLVHFESTGDFLLSNLLFFSFLPIITALAAKFVWLISLQQVILYRQDWPEIASQGVYISKFSGSTIPRSTPDTKDIQTSVQRGFYSPFLQEKNLKIFLKF